MIKSLLLGIPIPSIFVFEKENGTWELIDGLQRIATILEFMGRLRNPAGGVDPPSILEATKYLPSLHNAVWERSDLIPGVSLDDQNEIDKSQQLSIRRAEIGLEILKRPSDDQTKFDLFQRLNAGSQANPQELRNCIMLMVNGAYYRAVRAVADGKLFQDVITVTDDQIERQRHMEFAVRFLVHTYVPYDDCTLDVEEYIDEGIIALAGASNGDAAADLINPSFPLSKVINHCKATISRSSDLRLLATPPAPAARMLGAAPGLA